MATSQFNCAQCGSTDGDDVPLAYGPTEPYHATLVPDAERADRVKMPNKDFCSVDNHGFYLRGQLLIPIITDFNSKEEHDNNFFSWDIWVSQSASNYEKALNEMCKQGREKSSDPTFGYVSTELSQVYKEISTYNLPAMVTTQPVGKVPQFELAPDCEHPLAIEQRNGISMDRVREIASILRGSTTMKNDK